jgi:DNA-binding MarR family transcriptional regulator
VTATDPLDDDRLTLVGLLFEATSGVGRRLERRLLEASGISAQSIELLLRLGRTPEHRLRMSDLALQSTLTPSGLTRAIDRLVAEGFVVREACPTDRRSAYAVLTADGLALVRCAVPAHVDDIEAVFAELKPSERATLDKLLRKVRAKVNPSSERGDLDGDAVEGGVA